MEFSKIHLNGDELSFIKDVFAKGKTAGNGKYTKACQEFFTSQYGFSKCLLTTSCTDALEMAALLLNIGPGDEVIMPSYTFVSTANAFLLRGAEVVFADSQIEHPNLSAHELESLITPRTKAIVPVHYAGVACDMDPIMRIAQKYGLYVIEDAAQAIHSFYHEKPLGSIGHLGAMSFHETKNISAGECGALFINDSKFRARAEILWEKGTNRAAFFRGEVNKYGWVDIGSSFLPSEIIAAYLLSQLTHVDETIKIRCQLWQRYYDQLYPLHEGGYFSINTIPSYANHNGHIFYIITHNGYVCDRLIQYLRSHDIPASFHYQQLHLSSQYLSTHPIRHLENADRYTQCLVRLPLHNSLSLRDIDYVCSQIQKFFTEDQFYVPKFKYLNLE